MVSVLALFPLEDSIWVALQNVLVSVTDEDEPRMTSQIKINGGN